MLSGPAVGPGVRSSAMQGRLSVLVTDAEERSAVAACESLSRAGYRVGASSHMRFAPAHWSRFADQRFLTPHPRSRQFAERVAEIARENDFATVIPGSDGSVISLSTHRALFEGTANLGLPPREVVDECVSKLSLLEKAAAAGLASPETVVCDDVQELTAAAQRLGYPLVLKPRGTVFSHDGQLRQQVSALVPDEAALQSHLPQLVFPCLVQRREQGQILSVGGVFADGRLLAAVPSRYMRTWKPEAGSVSFSKTVDVPADLLGRVTGLVGSLGWEGIFELELIERSDGAFAALDFNPRIYGSLALAVSAGASLPSIWCDWLLRDRVSPSSVRPGVFYRWDDADLRHAWRYLRSGRVAAAAGVLRPRRGTAHPYFRPGDPGPGLARFLQMIRYSISRPSNGLAPEESSKTGR
jgi:predicted ATP-grasp superfamily ATP-dependent carboligase